MRHAPTPACFLYWEDDSSSKAAVCSLARGRRDAYLQLLGVHAASRSPPALQHYHLEAKAAQLPGSCQSCGMGILSQPSACGKDVGCAETQYLTRATQLLLSHIFPDCVKEYMRQL